MLHLKDGVLTKVDEALELLLVAALGDGDVEEGLLRLADLRLLPLLDVVLVNLEVDALDLVRRLDLDAAEELGGISIDFKNCPKIVPKGQMSCLKGKKLPQNSPNVQNVY